MKFPRHISGSHRTSAPVPILVVAVLWSGLITNSTSFGAPLPTEYQIKSAFLYNFAKYVQWPAGDPTDSETSFNICILGRDPFGTYFDTILKDKTMNGLPISVKRLSRVQDSLGCKILFISSSEENNLLADLAALDGKSVLTVGEMARFAERGGMIQFVVEQSRVRFEINLSSADRARLTISSQLLKLATGVRENRLGGD